MDEDGLIESDGAEGNAIGGSEIDEEGESEVGGWEFGVERVLREKGEEKGGGERDE